MNTLVPNTFSYGNTNGQVQQVQQTQQTEQPRQLSTILPPCSFIKYHCLVNGCIGEFTIRKIAFKSKSAYTTAVIEVSKYLADHCDITLGSISTTFTINKKPSMNSARTNNNSVDPITMSQKLKFYREPEKDTFLVKCEVILDGPDIMAKNFFSEVFFHDAASNEPKFEQEYQQKFINCLNTLNSQYGTSYIFSFNFSRTYVKKVSRNFRYTVQNNQLVCQTNESVTENAKDSFVAKEENNKKRRRYNDDSSDEDD